MKKYDAICIGTGEIGKPLYELVAGVYDTLPIDPIVFPENMNVLAKSDIIHLCIPGDLDNFNHLIKNYIDKYNPMFIFIHGTVTPGTTESLNDSFENVTFVNCPVHGKHHGGQMKKDMLRFKKYIGFPEDTVEATVTYLMKHLESIGFGKVVKVMGTKNTEWLKVLSTTYFGFVVAWAQEVERICDKFDLNYESITDIYKHQEDITPPHYSGEIGGHCVLPNIEIIKGVYDSIACDFIKQSNELKKERDSD